VGATMQRGFDLNQVIYDLNRFKSQFRSTIKIMISIILSKE